MKDQSALLEQLLKDLDTVTAGTARFLSGRISRRSVIGKLGIFLAGMGGFPMLPVLREAHAAAADELTEIGDSEACEYWRYCGMSGSLCSCCGGTITQCPPGSQTATVAWVGTCHNPADGVDYLISYNDCCGKSSCGRCGCHRSEGDRPVYFASKANSILWCFGSTSHAYHCTLARVLGPADTANSSLG